MNAKSAKVILVPVALVLFSALTAGWELHSAACRAEEAAGLALSEQAGPPGGKAAVQRTRYSLRHDADGWTFVAPDGTPFFSLGVCVLNRGTSQDEYTSEKPSYASWRHYDSPEAWAKVSLARLQQWGFTTVGGWSDYDTLKRSSDHSLCFTPVLHLGSSAGMPWKDMWDEDVLAKVRRVAEETMLPVRGDPRVLGYYSDNELGWWNTILWNMTLDQPASSGQRRRLIALLREHYDNDFAKLQADFDTTSLKSWEQLEGGGTLRYKPGSNGIQVMRRFLTMMAERYYQVMRDTIKEYDPGALYLGDRYQSFYYREVAEAAGHYVDVVSTNLNAHWNDGTFLRSYLSTLHALTKKPILVSEFYMSAEENRSNDPNSSSFFPVVPTQVERAAGIRNSLTALKRLDYVVGADWFQYYDEPPHGRHDGENYNFGLVDIEDRPYEEITPQFASQGSPNVIPSRASCADASGGVPRIVSDPFADFRLGTALEHWDRERGFIQANSVAPLADLYVCWNSNALYLGLYGIDVVETLMYGQDRVPEAERAVWTIQVNDSAEITVELGVGLPHVVHDDAIRVRSFSGVNHHNRVVALVEIPAARWGSPSLQKGDKVTLRSQLSMRGRGQPVEWKGSFTLAE